MRIEDLDQPGEVGHDNCFVLWLGGATRVVAYGPNVVQRGLDACLELHAEEEAAQG